LGPWPAIGSLVFGSVGALALITGSCVRADDRADAEPSTLTVLYPGDDRVLGAEGRAYYRPAQFLVFEPLMTWDADGELEPRLARSWEHSVDYRTWTVNLRTDVRWHDGVPVTADDVQFTMDLLSHPDVLVEQPGAFRLDVLDDSTFTITRQQIGTYSIANEAAVFNAIYPRHLLQDLDPKGFWDWEFWTHPVGNGPYRYVRLVPGTIIELEANPDHFRGRPRIDRVVLKFGGSSLTELLAGNVDAVAYVDRTDLLTLADDPRFRVYENVLFNSVVAIVWNHRDTLFEQRRVRQALTRAIDREGLHRVLNLPANLPIFDVVFTARQFRRGEVPQALAYDPERAIDLLEGAGWLDADADGLRERNGEPFHFTLLASGGESERAAVFVQEQLRNVGIEMEILTLQNIWERVQTADFQAAILPVFPGGGLSHTVFFGEESVLGYAHPTVARLLGEADATLSPVEIDRIYAELMPIFLEDQPMIGLYPDVRTTVAHRRVRGLSSPYRAEPVWHVDDLWIEEDERP
jgi:peptide/nickel transport system substrate-binding protein